MLVIIVRRACPYAEGWRCIQLGGGLVPHDFKISSSGRTNTHGIAALVQNNELFVLSLPPENKFYFDALFNAG
jgi:hypothetical protein